MGKSSLMQGQMKSAEGANKLQLGMLAMQKNDLKAPKVISVLPSVPVCQIKKAKRLLTCRCVV